MFNFKSIVDQVTTASKTPLTFVEDKALRSSLEAVVYANAEFVKTIYDTSLELSKQVVEKAKDYDYTKSIAELAEKFVPAK